MRGAPLKAVQELLGHADIRMSMRYWHLSPNVRRDAVELLSSPPSAARTTPTAPESVSGLGDILETGVSAIRKVND